MRICGFPVGKRLHTHTKTSTLHVVLYSRYTLHMHTHKGWVEYDKVDTGVLSCCSAHTHTHTSKRWKGGGEVAGHRGECSCLVGKDVKSNLSHITPPLSSLTGTYAKLKSYPLLSISPGPTRCLNLTSSSKLLTLQTESGQADILLLADSSPSSTLPNLNTFQTGP